MFEIYDKLYELTGQIYDRYDRFICLEFNNLQNTSQYKEQLEYLKLYKYLEDEYYNKLKKFDIEGLNKLAYSINVDDTISCDDSDFEFVLFHQTKNEFIKRRIIERIIDIQLSKESIDYFDEVIQHEMFPFRRGMFTIRDKIIVVGNRSKKLCEMLWNVNNNMLIKYLLFVQMNINDDKYKNFYVTNKYKIIFINQHIEDLLIKEKFNIADNSVIEYPLSDELDLLIYNTMSYMCMCSDIEANLSDLTDENITDKILRDILKTKIKSSSYYLSDDWKDMLISSHSDNKQICKLLKQ